VEFSILFIYLFLIKKKHHMSAYGRTMW